MSYHGYDPGDRNNWYQSPQLGLFPAGYGGGISGNYYCARSSHLQGHSYSQAQMVTNFTQPNPYPPPPHDPSATIINGHLLPHQFPCVPQSHSQFFPPPSLQPIHPIAPQLFTTTPQSPSIPTYHSPHPNPNLWIHPSIPIFQSPAAPTFVPQPQFTDPKPPSSFRSVGDCEPLALFTGRIRTIPSSSSSSSDPQTHEDTTNPSSLLPISGVSVQKEVLRSKPAFSTLIDKLEMLCQPLSVIGTEDVSLASLGRNSDEECRCDDAVVSKGTTNGVNLASTPELYPELVSLNTVPPILNLLSHDSTDIAIDAVQFLQNLTNEDTVDENDEPAKVVADALVDNNVLELLVQNLLRLSDSDAGEVAVIYSTLAKIGNLKEFEPSAAEFVCEKIKLLEWLMSKIKVKAFDTLNVYKEMKEKGMELNVKLGMPPRMAFQKLQLMGLPFLRPEDYYVKLVKSESQLGKVKSQFLVEMRANLTQTSLSQVYTTLNLNFQDVRRSFESFLSNVIKLYNLSSLNCKVGAEIWPPDGGEWLDLDGETNCRIVIGFLDNKNVKELATLIIKAQKLESSTNVVDRSCCCGIVIACVGIEFLDKEHSILDEVNAQGGILGRDVQVPILNALCKERRTAEATQLFMDISNSQPELDMNVLAKILLKSLDKEQVSSNVVIMDSIVAALCRRCIDSIELHVKMDDVGISFLNWLLTFPNAKFKREAASIRHSLAFYIDDQMGLEISTLKHELQTAKSTHESYCLQLEVNAKEVHGSAMRRCLFDLVLPNAVVNVYGQWGYIDYAYQMFKLVECKDVVSWMSTISCYVHYGLASEALELCRLMKEINVEPDYFNACGMHDHGKEAIDLFKRTEDQKIASDHIMFLAQVFHIKGQMETDHRLANHWEKIWLLIAIAIIQWHLNGATELILSNGMRVCYNSTNFLDEQFIITGFSFGGLFKLVASEYFYCSGPTIAGEMGVYGYRSSVLLNMLAGKRAEVSTNVGAYTRTINYNANNTSQTEFTGWLYVSLRYCFLSAIAMVTTFLLSVALALCVTALCVMMTIEKAHIAEFAEKAKKKLFLTILLQYGIPEVGEEFVSDIFCMQFAGLGKKTCRLGHGEVHNFCSLSDDTHTLGSLIINKASEFLLLRVTQIVQINRAANIGLEVCTGLRVINFNNNMIHYQPLIMPLLVIPAIVFIFEDQYCWNVDSSMTEHESVFLDKGAVENVHKWGWYKLRIVANAIMGVDYFFQAATLKEFRQEDVGNGIPLVFAPSIQDNEEDGGLIVNDEDVRAGVVLHDDGMMIVEDDITDGDKEPTIPLLWNMFVHLQLPLLVKKATLANETCKIQETMDGSINADSPPIFSGFHDQALIMILYSLRLIRAWHKSMGYLPFEDSNYPTMPWFSYIFLGLGVTLCSGHIAADTANAYGFQMISCKGAQILIQNMKLEDKFV